jgi:hypothetical protein
MTPLERSQARGRGEILTRTVELPEPHGVVAPGEEGISQEELRSRVGWLMDLVHDAAQARIEEVWEARRVDEITAKGAPSHAHVAMGHCYGKAPWPPRGAHASDRVRRMADEIAGRTLRAAARRLAILDAVLPTWATRAEWEAMSKREKEEQGKRLWAAMPDGTTSVEVLHALRQAEGSHQRTGRQPEDAYECSERPVLKASFLPLDACDRQQAVVEQASEGAPAVLRVLLPTRQRPRSAKDYAWHSMPLDMPVWARRKYAGWEALKPTLSLKPDGRVKILLPLEALAPEPPKGKERRGFSTDWGQKRTLTGAVVFLSETGEVETTGQQFVFQANRAQQKMYRNRECAEHLGAKVAQIERLLGGRDEETLSARLDVLLAEKSRQWQHLSERNEQLARTAAKWVIMMALAEGCGYVFHEDLADYEARGMGKTTNGRVSMQVRAAIFEQIAQMAPLFGLRVITVPAAGTSSHDSRCGRRTRHVHAPDEPTLGQGRRPHKSWVLCACGHSADRDHSAAERIGARGLQMLALIEADEAAWEAKAIERRRERALARSREGSPASAAAPPGAVLEAASRPPKRTTAAQAQAEARLRRGLDASTTPLVKLDPRAKARIGARAQSQPTHPTRQRPCGAASPRGVSRGTAVGESQAVAGPDVLEPAAHPSFREELSGSKCGLDRVLLGNWGSVRFTRIRP